MAGYLRQTWRTRPWAIAVAAEQLRVYADNPPGRLRLRLREYYRLPDVGLPPLGAEVEPPVPFSPAAWLATLAVRLRR
ncbi:hypothetical protein [Streptomyces sp. NPDC053431]|uniref:hypothetical protein n=1 Tax=Streptomyces sp. NPDC053431 TaxID=3365703 RepID=UPI0037D14656